MRGAARQSPKSEELKQRNNAAAAAIGKLKKAGEDTSAAQRSIVETKEVAHERSMSR